MHQNFSRKPLVSLVNTAIGLSFLFAASIALGSSTDAREYPVATGETSVTKQANSQHEHTLPSMFHKGFVYIKISINGQPDAWMILDTGSTFSMIDTTYANTIGLKLTPSAQAQETFGSMKADTFDTDTVHLRVGTEPEKAVLFQSITLGGMMGPDGAPAAGLLGHTFLEGNLS